jgi:hypothetical protein
MRLLLLFLLCALATAGQADDMIEPEQTAVLERAANPLGVIKFAQKPPTREASPVPLPVPVDPESTGILATSLKGPVAAPDGGLGAFYGSALVRPRGGTFSSPRQQADREIRRLISRLD